MRAFRTVLPVALGLAALSLPVLSAESQAVSTFRRWSEAVVTHTPATIDPALQAVWKLTPEDRQHVASQLPLFLKALDDARLGVTLSDDHAIAEIGRRLAPRLTSTTFLERAAMVHADAVMFDRPPSLAPQRAAGTATGPTMTGGLPGSSAGASSGLSPDPMSFVTIRDGEYVGQTDYNGNWPFARMLLDHISRTAVPDPFVALWYHATAAYLLRNGDFAELTLHLDHAATLLPTDARILFDRGCRFEALAMNLFQQYVRGSTTDGLAVHVFNRAGGDPKSVAQPTAQFLDVPSADEGNSRAAELFRLAVARDPSLAEARVRLARILELDGHYAEANEQIQLALSGPSDKEVAFYADLFGIRAADALGQGDVADTHIRAALASYPHAASALLAASYSALRRADPQRALDRLTDLTTPSGNPAPANDPWTLYPFGVGRQVKTVLTELWRAVPPVSAAR